LQPGEVVTESLHVARDQGQSGYSGVRAYEEVRQGERFHAATATVLHEAFAGKEGRFTGYCLVLEHVRREEPLQIFDMGNCTDISA